MPKNGTVAYVRDFPDCDFCKQEGKKTPASYDAKTTFVGSWAYVCENHKHWMAYPELGTGKGQRLEIAPRSV